jgi:ammonia channel protein AmtB
VAVQAFVTVIWTFVGFSVAFGDDIGGFMGNPATYFMYRYVFVNLSIIDLLVRSIVRVPCTFTGHEAPGQSRRL